jgi:hypothetical protein
MAPSETQQLRACGALWRHRAEHGAISLLKKRCADNHLQRHPEEMALLLYLAIASPSSCALPSSPHGSFPVRGTKGSNAEAPPLRWISLALVSTAP